MKKTSQERAAAQGQLQSGEDFAEIGTHALGGQVVDGLAAETEMAEAGAGAQKATGVVAERGEAETIALALGD